MSILEILKFLDATVLWKLKLSDLLMGMLVFALFLGIRYFILRRLIKRLRCQTCSYTHTFLSALKKPLSFFLILLASFAALGYLPLDPQHTAFIIKIFKGGSILSFAWAAFGLVDCLTLYCKVDAEKRADEAILRFCPFIEKALRIGIIVLGTLVVADNLGYSVNGIFAAFGLSGAVLAFASKDILTNFFNSLLIVIDQPFKVGDLVKIGSLEGVVESVGVRSTRLRGSDQSLLIIPNNVLINAQIFNWTSIQKRHAKQILRISCETTSSEKVTELIGDIRTILEQEEGIDKKSILVWFQWFSQDALEIAIVYVTVDGGKSHLMVRHRINLKFLELFSLHKISFVKNLVVRPEENS